MALNILGLAGVIVFYLLILCVGIVAAWIKRKRMSQAVYTTESLIIGGRELGYFVGIFTMTATWVGGGYLSGTVQVIFEKGLLWCQAPIGFSLSLIVSGILFAKPLRKAKYVTMLDPFQLKFGPLLGATAYLPALLGETFWSAFILRTLGNARIPPPPTPDMLAQATYTTGINGTTMSIVLGLKMWISCIISAVIAIAYTLFGGFVSVAYTDVVQLILIMFGLVLSIPFAWNHPASTIADAIPVNFNNGTLWGTITVADVGQYIDIYLLTILGDIPWQVYFQRVFASKSAKVAQILSIGGGFGCLIMAVPCMVVGVVAQYTNWTAISPELADQLTKHPDFTMPAVINYMTPKAVSFFGLGAMAAAVMSSSDSSLLSSSSMFAYNVYKNTLRPKAPDKEVIWVWRIAVLVIGTGATAMAILSEAGIYNLLVLCVDLVYVILFPPLFLLVYGPSLINGPGYISGYLVALTFRLLSGEVVFGIPAVISYPGFDGKEQKFPFRTFAMLVNFVVTIVISVITTKCCYRYFGNFRKIGEKRNNNKNSSAPAGFPEARKNEDTCESKF